MLVLFSCWAWGADTVVQPVDTSDELQEGFVIEGVLEGEGGFQLLAETCSKASLLVRSSQFTMAISH